MQISVAVLLDRAGWACSAVALGPLAARPPSAGPSTLVADRPGVQAVRGLPSGSGPGGLAGLAGVPAMGTGMCSAATAGSAG